MTMTHIGRKGSWTVRK